MAISKTKITGALLSSVAGLAGVFSNAAAEMQFFGGVSVGNYSLKTVANVSIDQWLADGATGAGGATNNTGADAVISTTINNVVTTNSSLFNLGAGVNLGLLFESGKFQYGVQFNGEILFGNELGSLENALNGYQVDPKWTFEALARLGISGEKASFYLLGGLGYIRTDVSIQDVNAATDVTLTSRTNSFAFAFGAGAELKVMDTAAVFLEYVHYYTTSGKAIPFATGTTPDAANPDVIITALAAYKPVYGVARFGFRYYFSF